MRHSFLIRTVFMVVLTAGGMPSRASYAPDVERGFRLLYEIRFAEARSEFLAWEKEQPTDPLRHAWEAAGYLFEEFYHHDMLTSGFFLDDKRLLGGVESTSNDEYRTGFLAASKSAQDLAKQRLASNPKDPDALFALTITTGLQANYAFLVEKRNLESLKLMRQAQRYAKDLLAIKPEAADAYLPLGEANYIISCLPVRKRFFLRLGGIRGDRELGMTQLETAALKGHYLRPFAKILLALAALREKQVRLARTQLEELTTEFPGSPLFARELTLLKKSASSTSASGGDGPSSLLR
ncbi:MAG: hypothetical protein ABSB82_10950 [Terriglobia bacterium]|jgi:hypothetical protein